MSEHRANLTLAAVTVTVAFAGSATLAVGAWPVSLGLLALAVVLLASQRSTLAQSLHTERRNRRRHLLLGAIVAIAVFACLVAVYLADIGDHHVGNGALMVYNVAGLLSLLSAAILMVVGPRTHDQPPATAPR